MEDSLTRLLLALFLISAGILAYALINRLLLHRAAAKNESLPGARRGSPVILYFTTPDCAPCRTIQRPALQQVQSVWGDCLQVIEVDATQQTDLASRWGVLSVPTTFLLDDNGNPRFVNHGATRAEKLLEQLNQLVRG
ncbi:MAG: thioredoxin family protein [Bellilinea sp.]|jgi:thioredoxin 1